MKKIFKVLAIIALVAVIGFSFSACDDDSGGGDTPVPVTGVSLNKTSLSLAVGGSETLTENVAPSNATNKTVTWTSSNTAIATVTNGLVRAVSAGSATIIVSTVDGGKTATCTVNVTGGSGGGAEPTPTITVTSNADNGAGTLRAAIQSASAGNIIAIGTGITTIELQGVLQITKNLTIQGKGVTLVKSSTWPGTNGSAIQVESGVTLKINRVHFKSFRELTGTGRYGSGIYSVGTIIVESCIFNNCMSNTAGGAIFSTSSSTSTTLKGCTFYDNSANSTDGIGGAVCVNGGTLTLVGNLFYGNNAATGPVVYKGNSATLISGGYNVSEIAKGTGSAQSGFADANDKSLTDLNISAVPINISTLVPKAEMTSLMIMPSTAINDFPLTDFNGVARKWPGVPGALNKQ